MPLLGKTLGEARVSLYNLKKFDVANGDPVLARVDAPGADVRIDGHAAIALIVPLTAVTLLRNTARAAELASPMMQLIAIAADQMLEGEVTASALHLREQIDMDPLQAL